MMYLGKILKMIRKIRQIDYNVKDRTKRQLCYYPLFVHYSLFNPEKNLRVVFVLNPCHIKIYTDNDVWPGTELHLFHNNTRAGCLNFYTKPMQKFKMNVLIIDQRKVYLVSHNNKLLRRIV